MTTFLAVYGAVALGVFAVFIVPVFRDWHDYSARDMGGCAAFAVVAGALWLPFAALLAAAAAVGAYYSWKGRNAHGAGA